MDPFPPALSHGSLKEVFPDVFFVTGAMETVLQGKEWQFSRNMVVVRDAERLVIVNSVRLNEEGLEALDALGKVTDVVRLGALHGRDDEFYVTRYKAQYWSPEGIEGELAQKGKTLSSGELPISDASFFQFRTTNVPEAILHLGRSEGVLLACDALQNWTKPDEYFSEASKELMTEMGFFTQANLGPVWVQVAEPKSDDFARLKDLSFKHTLCGHGEPLLNTAYENYSSTFNRIFGI